MMAVVRRPKVEIQTKVQGQEVGIETILPSLSGNSSKAKLSFVTSRAPSSFRVWPSFGL
jgi:hypothetical protein